MSKRKSKWTIELVEMETYSFILRGNGMVLYSEQYKDRRMRDSRAIQLLNDLPNCVMKNE